MSLRGTALAVGVFLIVAAWPSAAQSQFVLTELLPSGADMPPPQPTNSLWSGVKLVPAIAQWAAEKGLQSSIRAEVAKMQPSIQKDMPVSGGVLVVVGIQESQHEDVQHQRSRSVLEAHVGGAGASAEPVLRNYLSQPNLVKGPAEGFRRRDIFLWVAADPTDPYFALEGTWKGSTSSSTNIAGRTYAAQFSVTATFARAAGIYSGRLTVMDSGGGEPNLRTVSNVVIAERTLTFQDAGKNQYSLKMSADGRSLSGTADGDPMTLTKQ
jgi:hypothetical protein